MREMKDSGVEWIGVIPNDWTINQVRRHYYNVKRIAGDSADEYERLALTLKGVIKRSKEDNEGLQPEKFEGYQILKENELVFKMIDLENVNTSRVGLSTYTGLVSPAYIVLSNDSNDNRYAYYWFMSMYYQEIFNKLGGDGVRSALNVKDMLSLPIPNISLNQQKNIADYLDAKCSLIDSIIAKQEAIIEKLKEYKFSVITEAVTKGLNPNVEVKDSGVKWIGYIPKSWAIVKGHRIIQSTQNGLTRRDLEKSEGDIVLKLKNITEDGEISYKEVNRVLLSDNERETYLLKNGDFLFVRVNGSKNLVGKSAVFESIGENVAYNDHIIRVRLNRLCNQKFLKYYLISTSGKYEIETHTITSAGQYTISGDGLRDLFICLPPIEEQKKIIEFLDNKITMIDERIESFKRLICSLQDYRKSLIYEVVTGKKEV